MKIFSPKRLLILCIPPQGNTPLASKSICILSILSEPIGILLTGSFDPTFNRSILALPYLKFEIFAHAQIAVIFYCILFTSFFAWYEFKLTLGILFDKWNWSVILSILSRDLLITWSTWTVLLSKLLRPEVNFMAYLNVEISTKVLQM